MYTFYGYPKCSTCKKAVKHLENKGIFPEYIDIKLNPPTVDQLKEWMLQSKWPIRRFFNTSGTKYKELHLKDKLPNMTLDEKLELLSTNGMLVKRPILVGDDIVLTGFKEDIWKEVIING